MKKEVIPPKKGSRNEYPQLNLLREVASRFMTFCQSYNQFFTMRTRNTIPSARAYLTGLMMKAPRKNMERMEEYVPECNYESVQHFISTSPWDEKALNRQVRSEVNSLIGGSDSTLCIDESCHSKKGKESVGVSPQYNGRLGKVDNCQVARGLRLTE